MKDRKKLKVLLVQFRKSEIKDHELECVIKKAGLASEQIDTLNALEVDPISEHLDGYDVLMLGGAGSYCITEGGLRVLPNVYELVRQARKRKIPTLGICFGSHVLTVAFGGRLLNDKEGQETGTFEVALTDQGKQDPVFSKLPEKFMAQLGHKDFIMQIPEGAQTLATSELSGTQAWVFPNELVYAIQFHPELDEVGTQVRATYYINQYFDSNPRVLKQALDSIKPSPEAVKVFDYFLDQV
jgi:GMP synthase (glutamine-hydrolysing)